MTTAPLATASRPPTLAGLAGLAFVGAATGVAAKAADESGWTWAADLGTHPAAWVLAVTLIGRTAPTLTAAGVRAALFFAAMTVAYYLWASLVLGFPWTWLLPAWLVLSVTAVPVTAVAVRWATARSGAVPGLLLAGIAGIALAGGSLQRLHLAASGLLVESATRPVQAAVDLLVAAVIVLVLPLHRATRLWGLALLVPMAWAAAWALERFGGLLS